MAVVNSETLEAISLAIETRFRTALAAVPVEIFGDLIMEIPGSGKTAKFPIGGQLATVNKWVDERIHQSLAAWMASKNFEKNEITVDIDEDDVEDDLYGVYMPQIDNLAVELRNQRHDDAVAALATNGWSTDYPLWDGQPLFSDSHVYPGSGLAGQSNQSTNAFSEANYYTALAAWQGITRPNGKLFRGRQPTHFLHAKNIRSTVDATFKAMTKANGATNPLYGEFAPDNIRTVHEFPDGYWMFTKASGPNRPIAVSVRRQARYAAVTNPNAGGPPFEEGKFSFGFDNREVLLIVAWWDWYGSTGAG